jgi:glycosyltransferase involved in cell wall biosynthesis
MTSQTVFSADGIQEAAARTPITADFARTGTMKVLHLSSERDWRGGEQQIAYLVEESLKLGVEAIVACKAGSAMEAYLVERGLARLSLPFASPYDLRTAAAIKRYCAREKVDLVHLHSGKGHALGVLAGLLKMRVPMVLSRRVDFPLKDNWLSRFKYNHPDIKKIICVSDAIARIVGGAIRDPKTLATVHDGIDPRRFSEAHDPHYLHKLYRLPPATILIGNTSALAGRKDYFTFIDAAEVLLKRREDLHFFMIGDGPLKARLHRHIERKRLQGHITMTGFVKNIPQVLPALDLFLFTSKTEGLGTSLLDAMAAGVPVVATAAGGVVEVVRHGRNGLLSPVADAASLAENVSRVLSDDVLRRRLVQGGQATAEKFSKAAMAKNTVAIYQSLLHQEDGRTRRVAA